MAIVWDLLFDILLLVNLLPVLLLVVDWDLERVFLFLAMLLLLREGGKKTRIKNPYQMFRFGLQLTTVFF